MKIYMNYFRLLYNIENFEMSEEMNLYISHVEISMYLIRIYGHSYPHEITM